MTRDFIGELKTFCKKLEAEKPASVVIDGNQKMYNIHKITLPPEPTLEHGKVVIIGVSKEEADWWIEKKLKARVYQNNDTDSKTLVFYEKFLQGASPKERNIFYNPKPTLIEGD
jgi:hypothetical protein